MLKINMKYRKGTLILELRGKMLEKYSRNLNNYLEKIIKKHQIKRVVYDTQYLIDIDLFGLNVLKTGVSAVKNNGGQVYFTKKSQILYLEGWYGFFKTNRRQ